MSCRLGWGNTVAIVDIRVLELSLAVTFIHNIGYAIGVMHEFLHLYMSTAEHTLELMLMPLSVAASSLCVCPFVFWFRNKSSGLRCNLLGTY